jgi:hypothetical protein
MCSELCFVGDTNFFSYVKILCSPAIILELCINIRKSSQGHLLLDWWLCQWPPFCAASSRKDRTPGGEGSTQDRDRAAPGPTWTTASWNATMDVCGSLHSHDGSWALPFPNASGTTPYRPHVWPTPTNVWNSATAPATSGCTIHISFDGTSSCFHAPRHASLCNVWDSTFWNRRSLYAICPLSWCWEPFSCWEALCSIPFYSSTHA